MGKRSFDIHQGFARTDPVTLGKAKLDVKAHAPGCRHLIKPVDSELWSKNDRPAHEDSVGHVTITKAADDLAGL